MAALKGPLAYLRAELGFTGKEWLALSTQDRDDLKDWANTEMKALGITE